MVLVWLGLMVWMAPLAVGNDLPSRPTTLNPSSSNDEEALMWPYPTYKPISWDKYYYAHDTHDKHISLTSGLAAGITIGVFFAVFALTFGCRFFQNQRSESLRRLSNRSGQSTILGRRRLSVSDFFSCNAVPDPPPPYEVAIRMPPQGQPPPFSEVPTQCECGHSRPS